MQREGDVPEKGDITEKEDVVQDKSQRLSARHKGASTRICEESDAAATATDKSSNLLPAGSTPNAKNSQGGSPQELTMDEACDSRSKSPIAVVEA